MMPDDKRFPFSQQQSGRASGTHYVWCTQLKLGGKRERTQDRTEGKSGRNETKSARPPSIESAWCCHLSAVLATRLECRLARSSQQQQQQRKQHRRRRAASNSRRPPLRFLRQHERKWWWIGGDTNLLMFRNCMRKAVRSGRESAKLLE